MNHNRSYIDGSYILPRCVGEFRGEYPFRDLGDTVTQRYRKTYLQNKDQWVPTAYGTVDPAQAGYYLVEESAPDTLQGSLYSFTRRYSSIPQTHTTYSSIAYSRPNVPGTTQYREYGAESLGNSGLFYQVNTAAEYYQAYSRHAVLTDGGISNVPTGGTATLSAWGNTSPALAYNVSAASMLTALNTLYSGKPITLSSITGNYNDPNGFVVTHNDVSAGSLPTTVSIRSGCSMAATVTPSNGGYTQTVAMSVSAPNWSPVFNKGSLYAGGSLVGGWIQVQTTLQGVYQLAFQISAFNHINAGAYTLTILGQTTASINYDATASAILSAINALSNVSAYGGFNTATGGLSSGVIAFTCNIPADFISGGNFTLNLLGQTTGSIAYNSDAATIQAAINGLSNVAAVGGCSVSSLYQTNSNISFSVDISAPLISGASSLTPSPSSVVVTPTSSSRKIQYVKFSGSGGSRLLTFSYGHGFSTGATLYCKIGGTYTFGVSNWTYTSANQITVSSAVAPWNNVSTIQEVGAYQGVYQPGPCPHTTRKIESFWLPGVSDGITTPADIPAGSASITDVSYLDAVCSGASFVNYSETDLETWDGPILKRTKVELKIPRL